MKNAKYTKSGIQFVVYVKNISETENEIDHLGVFPTFQEAVDFRKDFMFTNYDLDGEDYVDLTDEQFEEVFEEEFHGGVRDWVLEAGDDQYIIDEVPVYGK